MAGAAGLTVPGGMVAGAAGLGVLGIGVSDMARQSYSKTGSGDMGWLTQEGRERSAASAWRAQKPGLATQAPQGRGFNRVWPS